MMVILMSILLQKQLGTTLHKSQQRIDQRIKKWQDLRQAVESVKVSKNVPNSSDTAIISHCGFLALNAHHNSLYFLCIPSALCPNSLRREWADLHWTFTFHREEVQWSQGDDPLSRKDHRDTGGDVAWPNGGGDHSSEEEAHWLREALSHRWSHTLSTGEVPLYWGPQTIPYIVQKFRLFARYMSFLIFPHIIIYQSWQSLSGPSGYEDLNNISVTPYYSFDATKRAIASLKIQVEEISKIEMSKISGAGRQFCLSHVQLMSFYRQLPDKSFLVCLYESYVALIIFYVSFHSEGSLHHTRRWDKDKEGINFEGTTKTKRGTKDKRRTKNKRGFHEMWVIRVLFKKKPAVRLFVPTWQVFFYSSILC